jgi:hypothetical protein
MSVEATAHLISVCIIGLLIVWVPCLQVLDRRLRGFVISHRRPSNQDSLMWTLSNLGM